MWGVLQRILGMEVLHLENGGTISLLSDCEAIAEADRRDPVQWVPVGKYWGLERIDCVKLTDILLNASVPKRKDWRGNAQPDQKGAKKKNKKKTSCT